VRHPSDDPLELSIYEAKTKRWRRIAAHAPAVGPMNFCGLSERQAIWCPVHAAGAWYQDLRSGALTVPEALSGPPATAWSAVLHRGTERDGSPIRRHGSVATNGIELVGPGPTRWADDAEDRPASTVLTCQASNRALVLRAATRQMEMRTLPDWRLLRSWSGTAELVDCSNDGKRVAWLATCDGKSMLVSIAAE
jgi:hypothetical protein